MTGNRESVIGSVVGGTAAWPLSYVGSKRSHSLAAAKSPAAGEIRRRGDPKHGSVTRSENIAESYNAEWIDSGHSWGNGRPFDTRLNISASHFQ